MCQYSLGSSGTAVSPQWGLSEGLSWGQEQGLRGHFLFGQEKEKEMLVVAASQPPNHHLRWEQGSEISSCCRGTDSALLLGDMASGSWVLICWFPTIIPAQGLLRPPHYPI